MERPILKREITEEHFKKKIFPKLDKRITKESTRDKARKDVQYYREMFNGHLNVVDNPKLEGDLRRQINSLKRHIENKKQDIRDSPLNVIERRKISSDLKEIKREKKKKETALNILEKSRKWNGAQKKLFIEKTKRMLETVDYLDGKADHLDNLETEKKKMLERHEKEKKRKYKKEEERGVPKRKLRKVNK